VIIFSSEDESDHHKMLCR